MQLKVLYTEGHVEAFQSSAIFFTWVLVNTLKVTKFRVPRISFHGHISLDPKKPQSLA